MDSVTEEIIDKATLDVQEFGDPSFEATDVYIITWDGVVIDSWYYSWWYWYYHRGSFQRCTASNHVCILHVTFKNIVSIYYD